ncbi:MAG: MucBP domain-containing protein, partial [Ruminococcus sp.]|nr:MucBP domain-containing protein [Ruminococcus sp.]
DDNTDSIIADSTVLRNREGQAYESPGIPAVDGYTLNIQRLPKNACGEFDVKNTTVKYYYTKKAKDDLTCRVNIVYMSTDGKILGTNTLTGDEGNHYKTSQLDIENYEFKSVSDNSSGEFSQLEHNVLYIYTPVSFLSNLGLIIGIAVFAAAIILFAVLYRKRRREELMKKLDIGD